MYQAAGLVPARFLTMVSHLVLCVTIFLSREDNVLACLPFEYTEEDRRRKVGRERVEGAKITFVAFFPPGCGWLSQSL